MVQKIDLSNISSAIICGGKSSRFGETKGLAVLGNEQLIERALKLAGQISSTTFLCYGDDNLFSIKNVLAVKDIAQGCGPLSGIYSALTHAVTPWVAVLPCDMPLLTKQVYHILYTFIHCQDKPIGAQGDLNVKSFPATSDKTCCKSTKKIPARTTKVPIVAVTEKGMEPMVSVWPVAVIPHLKSALENKHLSLYKMLAHLRAIEVYLPDYLSDYHNNYFLNINRKEDLETAQKVLFSSTLKL